MKYFIDTEFIEGFHKPTFGKGRHFIDLISIGIIAEDGRKYYAISNEFNPKDADKWVTENVVSKLAPKNTWSNKNNDGGGFLWKSNKQIAAEIIDFVNPKIKDLIYTYTRHDCWAEVYYPKEFEYIRTHNTIIPDHYFPSGAGDEGYKKNRKLIYNQPEFYGYYGDYDWVLFCSLFGRMIDLPKGFPMYLKDLKQMLDDKLMQEYPVNNTTVTLLNSKLRPENIVEIRAMKTLPEKLKWIKEHCREYPKQKNEHNALDDAEWNKNLYDFIIKL